MKYTQARELIETILDQLDEELTKEAKAMARGHMVKRYGKGKVTFSSGSNGHYAEHDDGKGDTASHTFHPKTGKISREPRVTSSYYGESTTITEGAVKGLLNDMGYFFTDEGKHAGKWVHEKTGKALSDDHATKIAAERHARKKKSVGNKDSAAFKRGY